MNKNPLKVSVITAWHNHPELIPAYEEAVQNADQLIIVDNGSNAWTAQHLKALCERFTTETRKGVYVRFEENKGYGLAANHGLKAATGNLIVCLNNDVKATGDWIGQLKAHFDPCAIMGKSISAHYIEGVMIPYVDGWVTAASSGVWQALDGYDMDTFEFCYYEDADLSFRAVADFDYRLKAIPDLLLQHLEHGGVVGNTTSREMMEVRDRLSAQNREKFFVRVKERMEMGVTR